MDQHRQDDTASYRLPLFPLNTVLFPGCRLPLQIFEQRYLRLIRECMHQQTGFVTVLIEKGHEVGEVPQVFSVGNYAEIVDWELLVNGLLGITIEAVHKVHIDQPVAQHDGLLTASIQEIPNADNDPSLLRDYTDFREVLEQLMVHPLHQLQAVDYRNSFDVLNKLSYMLPISSRNKQQLLEAGDPVETCELLRSAILQLQARGRALT